MTGNRQQGFTLMEVLIAVAITSLVLTAVYGVFTSVAGAKQRLEGDSEDYHKARIIFDRLGRELRGAYLYLHGTPNRTFLRGGEDDEGNPFLTFTTTASTLYGGNRGGLSVVRYELKPDEEAEAEDGGTEESVPRVLMRNEFSIVDPDGAAREGYRLAPGIREMTFRFNKGDQWYTEWPGTLSGLPDLVEVTLVMTVNGVETPFRSAFDIPVKR